MDKLSELSKPVAWPNGCNETAVNALLYLAEKPRPSYGNSMFNTEHLYMIAREIERMASQQLYSQEYVSALDEVAQYWIGQSAEWKQRAEAAAHRIAELERITDGVDQLAIDGGWTARGMSEYAKSLEQRLSTPVQLPDGLAKKIKVTGYYEALNEMMDCVRAAGFKCVGDE
ncbi:Uncharacterised protein [Serratia quinivorans]|uniref:hypothetical protein n=1 Tax=Serratia quinivorans TaxID=137545 RepID=UPI00217AB496|nr:hypothetical protein [Serratia quinivorans]CAI1527736.1 Uncharacterised protein [Serratia quinivorans]